MNGIIHIKEVFFGIIGFYFSYIAAFITLIKADMNRSDLCVIF